MEMSSPTAKSSAWRGTMGRCLCKREQWNIPSRSPLSILWKLQASGAFPRSIIPTLDPLAHSEHASQPRHSPRCAPDSTMARHLSQTSQEVDIQVEIRSIDCKKFGKFPSSAQWGPVSDFLPYFVNCSLLSVGGAERAAGGIASLCQVVRMRAEWRHILKACWNSHIRWRHNCWIHNSISAVPLSSMISWWCNPVWTNVHTELHPLLFCLSHQYIWNSLEFDLINPIKPPAGVCVNAQGEMIKHSQKLLLDCKHDIYNCSVVAEFNLHL